MSIKHSDLKSFLIVFAIVAVSAYPFWAKFGIITGADTVASHLPYFCAWYNRGEVFPLWQDNSHTGLSALVNCPYGYYYPFNFLLWLWGPFIHLRMYWLVHFLLLAWGLRCWLRIFCNNNIQVHGVVMMFMTSLTMMAMQSLGHMLMLMGYAWGIWMLYFMHQLLKILSEAPDWRRALNPLSGIALCTGMTFLGGNPQVTHHSVCVVGLYGLMWWMFNQKFSLFYGGTILIVAAILGAGLGYVQIQPVFEFIRDNERNMGTQELGSLGTLTPSLLAKCIVPYLWGTPQEYWGQGSFWLGQCSLGMAGWSLLLLGSSQLLKDRLIRTVFASALILILLAIGPSLPVYSLYSSVIPLADSFRFPMRYLPYAVFFLLPLLLRGMQTLQEGRGLWWYWVVPFFISVVLLGNATMDLLGFWQSFLPVHVLERFQSPDKVFLWSVLAAESVGALALYGALRFSKKYMGLLFCLACFVPVFLFSRPEIRQEQFLPRSHFEKTTDRIVIRHQESWHNAHLMHGVSSLVGYDSFVYSSYRAFLDTLEPQNFAKLTREQVYHVSSPALSFLNVGYIVNTVNDLREPSSTWEKRPCKDRYYLTHDFSWPGREASIYTKLIVQKQSELKEKWEREGYNFLAFAEKKASLQTVQYQPERILLKVETDTDLVLASSDALDAHWKARVNGTAAPLFAWFGAFRSLPLHAGIYDIELYYDPPLYIWLGVSVLSGIIIGVLFMASSRKDHRLVHPYLRDENHV